jgi:hypothetical protein
MASGASSLLCAKRMVKMSGSSFPNATDDDVIGNEHQQLVKIAANWGL